jgi:hypothetical protein
LTRGRLRAVCYSGIYLWFTNVSWQAYHSQFNSVLAIKNKEIMKYNLIIPLFALCLFCCKDKSIDHTYSTSIVNNMEQKEYLIKTKFKVPNSVAGPDVSMEFLFGWVSEKIDSICKRKYEMKYDKDKFMECVQSEFQKNKCMPDFREIDSVMIVDITVPYSVLDSVNEIYKKWVQKTKK